MRKVTFDKSLVDNNVEVSVRHLKQYFKFGHGSNSLTTKAVHDVSFDIKKGECFGVVGESGCGKTTTGRSLIRLYNITSGSVYFEGHRISAGKRWNEKEIKWTRIKGKNKIKALRSEMNSELTYVTINKKDVEPLRKLQRTLGEKIEERANLKANYEEACLNLREIEDLELRANKKSEIKHSYNVTKKQNKRVIKETKANIRRIEKTRVRKHNHFLKDYFKQGSKHPFRLALSIIGIILIALGLVFLSASYFVDLNPYLTYVTVGLLLIMQFEMVKIFRLNKSNDDSGVSFVKIKPIKIAIFAILSVLIELIGFAVILGYLPRIYFFCGACVYILYNIIDFFFIRAAYRRKHLDAPLAKRIKETKISYKNQISDVKFAIKEARIKQHNRIKALKFVKKEQLRYVAANKQDIKVLSELQKSLASSYEEYANLDINYQAELRTLKFIKNRKQRSVKRDEINHAFALSEISISEAIAEIEKRIKSIEKVRLRKSHSFLRDYSKFVKKYSFESIIAIIGAILIGVGLLLLSLSNLISINSLLTYIVFAIICLIPFGVLLLIRVGKAEGESNSGFIIVRPIKVALFVVLSLAFEICGIAFICKALSQKWISISAGIYFAYLILDFIIVQIRYNKKFADVEFKNFKNRIATFYDKQIKEAKYLRKEAKIKGHNNVKALRKIKKFETHYVAKNRKEDKNLFFAHSTLINKREDYANLKINFEGEVLKYDEIKNKKMRNRKYRELKRSLRLDRKSLRKQIKVSEAKLNKIEKTHAKKHGRYLRDYFRYLGQNFLAAFIFTVICILTCLGAIILGTLEIIDIILALRIIVFVVICMIPLRILMLLRTGNKDVLNNSPFIKAKRAKIVLSSILGYLFELLCFAFLAEYVPVAYLAIGAAVYFIIKFIDYLVTKGVYNKKYVSESSKRQNQIRSSYEKQIKEIENHISETKKTQKAIIKQINYDNRHVDKKLLSKMQMIFQDPVDSLDPRMTVEDIIQEGLKIQGQRNKFANSKKVADVLTKVGLIPEFASRYPHEFSGGQRQRIGIARALVMNPSFLICDEPISALDVSIRAQIINLLNDLKEEMGLTIMFIAHDLSVVKYFCDRIAVMYFGEMVELASSEELFKHPLHPYAKALLSAIPKPDPLTEKTRKRIVYEPNKVHDYSKEKPTLQEITKGHWILANSEEMAKYREEIKELDKKAKNKKAH